MNFSLMISIAVIGTELILFEGIISVTAKKYRNC